MTIYEYNFFLLMDIISCIFIIEIISVFREFTKNKQTNWYIYRGLEYIANACGSWFLMKGAPLGHLSGWTLHWRPT